MRKRKALLLSWVFVSTFLFGAMHGWAATYYVSTAGSDANSCATAQSSGSSAKLTVVAGMNCLSASDTLKIQAGTYDVNRSVLQTPIPSGSSGNPTIVTDNGDGQVVLHHPGSGFAGILYFTDSGKSYISIVGTAARQIKIDMEYQNFGANIYAAGSPAPSNFTFENIEITRANASGVLGGHHHNQTYINCDIHDNGTHSNGSTPQDHGLYVTGNNLTITGSRIYNNWGWGLHIYSSNSNPDTGYNISGNTIYHNGYGSGSQIGDGIILEEGQGSVTNNVIYGNSGSGIAVWRATGIISRHNTIHNNGRYGIGIRLASGSTSNNTIQNNLIIDNGLNPIIINSSTTGSTVTWNKVGVGESINTSGDGGATVNNNTTTGVAEVEWVDSITGTLNLRNYELTPNALAIDAGLDLTASVPLDFTGFTRDSSPDQGAYEFDAAPPNPDGTLDLSTNTISWTMSSEAGFTHYRVYMDCVAVSELSPYFSLPKTDAIIKKDGTGTYNDLTNAYIVPRLDGEVCDTVEVRVRPISSGTPGNFSTEVTWVKP